MTAEAGDADRLSQRSARRSRAPQGSGFRGTAWYLAGGAVTVALFFALPHGGAAQRATLAAGSIVTAIAIAFGIVQNRPSYSIAWWLLAASMGAYFPAAIMFNFAFSFPSPADAIFFVSYGLQLVALALIVRRRTAGAAFGYWVEAAIVILAAALAAYVFFVRPYLFLEDVPILEAAASLGYPLVDTLLLLVVLVLALSFGPRSIAFWLLVASVASQLVADVFYAYSLLGGWFDYADPFFAGWFVAWTFLGAAALHPSMRDLAERAPPTARAHYANPLRVPLLGIAATTPSIINVAGYLLGANLPVHLISATSIVLVLLMTIRISANTRALERANARLLEREIEMQAAVRAAEQANAEKDRFLSRVSHELRTPLTSILGFAEVMQEDEVVPERRENVEQILAGGRHLLDLINDLLDISRLERGEVSLSMERVAIRPLLDEVAALMQPVAGAHRITLRADTLDVKVATVKADALRLRQIVLNLISNAIKYNRVNGSVTLRASRRGETIRVEVEDTGMGLTEEQVGRLFIPFERLGAESVGVEGTGLGLAVSKRLAQAMRSDVLVRSAAGAGSVFWLDLVRDVDATSTDIPAVDPPRPAEVGPGGEGRARPATVLYIDDNPANLKLMQRIFAKRPHVDLRIATDAAAGLDIAHVEAPDVILLDLNLPDMWGGDVLRRLRNDPMTSETPVVIVTADARPDRIQELLREGASGYLAKPFELSVLLATIDSYLAGTSR